MLETRFTSPFGTFDLHRYPLRKNETLRAWDAADELLLNYLSDNQLLPENNLAGNDRRILIVNDGFGGLTTPLANYTVTNRSDSFTAQFSCQQNLSNNELDTCSVEFQSSLDALSGHYDLVLIKVPKTLAFLDDQLKRIRPFINADTTVIGAGMVKQIHNSTLDIFANVIGETHTSLAKKKARLIFATVEDATANVSFAEPVCWPVPEYELSVVNHANVFAREKLDIGARLFLQYIPSSSEQKRYQQIIDLGCGNGVIGFRARQLNPEAAITFVDESYMAVESARQGYLKNFANQVNSEFIANDALSGFKQQGKVADLILCNPPFHQQQVIGDHIAWRMFTQAKDLLCQGGELRIVGNRHLNYHVKLKRIFGHVKTIASNRKFVILSSIKR